MMSMAGIICIFLFVIIQEILQNPFSHTAALFRMELGGKEIVFMESRAVGLDIVRRCNSAVAERYVETMDEIHELRMGESFKQCRFRVIDGVPSHLGDLLVVMGRNEPLYRHVENAKAIRVAFFTMPAHQLHPDADPQYWLPETFYQLVELSLAEVLHGTSSFPLTWKHDTVRLPDDVCIVSYDRLYAKAA